MKNNQDQLEREIVEEFNKLVGADSTSFGDLEAFLIETIRRVREEAIRFDRTTENIKLFQKMR